ncbi:MAG: hypothetical protein ACFFD2_03675 [Promethearchaeota archaeon]
MDDLENIKDSTKRFLLEKELLVEENNQLTISDKGKKLYKIFQKLTSSNSLLKTKRD